MLYSLAVTIVLVCSGVGDSLPQLPQPLDLLPENLMAADSLQQNNQPPDDSIAHAVPLSAPPVDSESCSDSRSAIYPIHQFCTPEGLNIESTESDIVDELSDEEPPTILLVHNESTGIGTLIPGSILTTIGTIFFAVALGTLADEPTTTTRDERNVIFSAGIALSIGGTFLNLNGAYRLSKYIHAHNRYKPATTRRLEQ